MRLFLRLPVLLGVMLVMFFRIQPALAIPNTPELFPFSQALTSSFVFEPLAIRDALFQNAGAALLQEHQDFLSWNNAQYDLNYPNTEPPFWQNWQFGIILVIVLAGAIAYGFQWRVRIIKDNARRLEALVQQRTSELREANKQLEVEIEQRKQAEEALAAERCRRTGTV